jgi:hypothetical protein
MRQATTNIICNLTIKRLLLPVLWILFLQCFIVVILEITEIISHKLQMEKHETR